MIHILFKYLLFFLVLRLSESSVEVCIPIPKDINVGGISVSNVGNLVTELKTDFNDFVFGNPTKDSYYLGDVDVQVDHPAIRLNGTLTNVTVFGLSRMVLCFLDHFNFFNVKETFDLFTIKAPNISFTGSYDLTGNVGDLFDIYGKGPFWMHIYNFSVEALNVSAYMSEDDKKFCFPINVTVKFEKVKSHFYGLMNDPELEDLFNKAIMSLAPEAVEIVWREIKDNTHGSIQKLIERIEQEIFNKKQLIQMTRSILTLSNYKLWPFPICYGKKS